MLTRLRPFVPFLAVFLITCISFLYPGYSVLTGDQELYIPQILAERDPSFIKDDIVLSFRQTSLTLFDEAINVADTLIPGNIYITFLVLSFIIRYLFFYVIFLLAKKFTGNIFTAMATTAVFLIPFAIFGTGTSLLDYQLVPRTVAFTFGLFFIYFLLEDKRVFALLALGVAIIMHIVTALPFGLLLGLELLYRFFEKKLSWQTVLQSVAIPAIFIALLLLTATKGASPSLGTIDPTWLAIILRRDPYLWISAWLPHYLPEILGFFVLWAFDLYFVIKQEYLSPRNRFLLICLGVMPWLLSILSYILADKMHIALFVAFQFSRALVLFLVFGVLIFFSIVFTHLVKQYHKHEFFMWLGLALAGLLICCISNYFWVALIPLFVGVISKDRIMKFSKSMKVISYATLALTTGILIFVTIPSLKNTQVGLPAAPHAIVPSATLYVSFTRACNWIQHNTQPTDLFVTEPYSYMSTPIRVFCDRPVYFTKKDGAQASLNRIYALTWDQRRTCLKSQQLPREASYLFSEKPISSFGTPVYKNEHYWIYNLTNSAAALKQAGITFCD